MMIGARFYFDGAAANAPKSLTNEGAALPSLIEASGFDKSLYQGDWTATAWIRSRPSAYRAIAFMFGGAGFAVLDNRYPAIPTGSGFYAYTGLTVPVDEWLFVMVQRTAATDQVYVNGVVFHSAAAASASRFDRLRLLANGVTGVMQNIAPWCGEVTRLCIFPRALTRAERIADMERGASAPDGAAHWWSFADAGTGEAVDAIGGVRLQIPRGFVSRATPWT